MRLWLGAAVHGGLLLVAVVVSYWIWRSNIGTENKDESVALWGGAPPVRLFYRSPKKETTLAFGDDGRLWGNFVGGPAHVPDKSIPSGSATSDNTPPTEPPYRFLGNERAISLMETFASPRATRRLGGLDTDALAKLGLEKPVATLSVETVQHTRLLEIGAPTFGAPGVYVRLLENGVVFVVPQAMLDPLKYPKSYLKQTDPFGLTARQVERLELVSVDHQENIVRLSPPVTDLDRTGRWAFAASPDIYDESATDWVGQLFRLGVESYETNSAPDCRRLFTIRFYQNAELQTTAVLCRSDEGKTSRCYIESSYLGTPATVLPGQLKKLLEGFDKLKEHDAELPVDPQSQ